jgi:hypothetical protein
MNRIKTYRLYFSIIFFALAISCGKDDPQPVPFAIDSFAPTSGVADTEVTITGSGFSVNTQSVKFNGVSATVVSATATQVVAKVPQNAGTGKITIESGGKTATSSADFVYIPFAITSFTPTSGTFDTEVTITGTGFSATLSELVVKFNNKAATVVSSTTTQVKVKVPQNSGTGKITIDLAGGTATSNIDFTHIPTYDVTTLAGGGSGSGDYDGQGVAATFASPAGITIDAANNLYVGDVQWIRKITPTGLVTTFAGLKDQGSGYVDGDISVAKFEDITDLVIDGTGTMYVCDGYYRLRKITPQGVVSTLAGNGIMGDQDGTGTNAQFEYLNRIALLPSGNLLVTDDHRIRQVTTAGVVTTLTPASNGSFEDGSLATAKFFGPEGMAITQDGIIYIADSFNRRIRKIANGQVTTFAGNGEGNSTDGVGTAAVINDPLGLCLDAQGNLFVSQRDHRIRKITPAGQVTMFAGDGTSGSANGAPLMSTFKFPWDIVFDTSGNMFVADRNNKLIRKISVR